jgi:hypothetical protein
VDPEHAQRTHLRIAGLGVRGDATLADFLPRSMHPSDRPTVAAVEVWPSPDVGWPVVPTAHADVVPPEYRGVIPDELLVPAQDVTLLKWLGRGSFGEVYKALFRGCVCAVKVCHSACA